jgi:O-antigen ligase
MSNRQANRRHALPTSDRLVVAAVSLAIAYPSWVWGGADPGFAWPMAGTALFALAALIVAPLLSQPESGGRFAALRARLAAVSTDPFFYSSVAFLVLVGIQWRNAWWPEEARSDWFSGRAPAPGWPSCIAEPEGRVAFLGFANAFAAALCVRHGIGQRSVVRALYTVLLFNACALAVFGFIQYFSGTNSLYWTWPRTRHFFASFFYENHAGQFFLLAFCLAGVQAARRLTRPDSGLTARVLALPFVLLALAFLATVFSLSRTSIAMVCAAFLVMVWQMGRRLAAHTHALVRLYALIGLVAICLTGLVIVSGAVGENVWRDFTRRRRGQSIVEQAYEDRVWQWAAAARMWKNWPWFGVGSYGFHYYLPFYTPAEHMHALTAESAGNVHNDFLYFLAEYGVVGMALLLTAFVGLVAPALATRRSRSGPTVVFPLLGAGGVLLHGAFDLPFRCPAVLAFWAVVVAATGRYLSAEPSAGGDAPGEPEGGESSRG